MVAHGPMCNCNLSFDPGGHLCIKARPRSVFTKQTKTISLANPRMDFLSCCFAPRAKVNAEQKLNDAVSFFQKYKITNKIGNGGTAEVWEAVDKKTGEIVAIKMPNTKVEADWMAREFSIMRKFDSPYVIRPKCFFESKYTSFMVMKKYDGCLFDLIEAGPVEGDELKYIVKQIATGLKTIHDAGYVHRDIKPENILMDKDGVKFVIADFGLAEDEYCMTVRTAVGTGSYMAPEIAEGVLRPDKALLTVGKPIDVYALGQLMYALITRRNAIPQSASTQEIIRNNLRFNMTHYIDELDVSDELKDLLYGMTDRNPVSRLTIDEVLAHSFLL
ncbi:serine/threonine-protein kinase [Acanthocystis turfacea Chlorella virus GM0701.1]|nr:serine/threonine-protein kinase [Acanthocystis turfacea Chlorella virus GM0701.1]